MKLTELRACDGCSKPLTYDGFDKNTSLQFYRIRISSVLLNPRALRETIGLATYYGGIDRPGALTLAEALGPRPEEVALVLSDQDKTLETELLLCTGCYIRHESLAAMVEGRRALTRDVPPPPLAAAAPTTLPGGLLQ